MLRVVVCLVAAFALSANIAMAQPEKPAGDRPQGDRPQGDRGPGGRPQFLPPLVKALDANGDGELSSDEIEGATAALKKIDKNADGKLGREELFGPGFGVRPGGPGGPGNRPGGSVEDRIKQMDKDGDGKISKDEAPERMKESFDKIDKNSDGFLDKEEISAMFQGGGRRPDGEGRKKPEGDKPARPISEKEI